MGRVGLQFLVLVLCVTAPACSRQSADTPNAEAGVPGAALVGTWALDASAIAETESFLSLSEEDRAVALQQVKEAATEMYFDGTRLRTTTYNRGRKMSQSGTYTLETIEDSGALVLATKVQGREATLRAEVVGDRLTLHMTPSAPPTGLPGAAEAPAESATLVFVRR